MLDAYYMKAITQLITKIAYKDLERSYFSVLENNNTQTTITN